MSVDGRATVGLSQDTWFLTIERAEGSERAVLRLPTPASGTRAIITQRASLEAVAGRLPAPALLWHDDGEDNPFGRPFLVMGRVDGEVPVGWHDLPEPRRTRIGEHAMEVLAALHATDPGPLEAAAGGGRAAPTELDWYSRRLERLAPLPAVLTGALWWLERHRPPAPEHPVLVHGDYRMGNLIVDGDRIAAVLDWEMAAPGDALADVAWCFIPLWAPPGVDERALVGRYAERTGTEVDDGALPLAPGARLRAARLLRARRHARLRLGPLGRPAPGCAAPAAAGPPRPPCGYARRRGGRMRERSAR